KIDLHVIKNDGGYGGLSKDNLTGAVKLHGSFSYYIKSSDKQTDQFVFQDIVPTTDDNTLEQRLDQHISDTHNPHNVTAEQVSTNSGKTVEESLAKIINTTGQPINLYVDATNGDDSNSGAEGSPFKTINKA